MDSVSWPKKIISGIAQVAQFRVNLRGILFLEYLIASFILSLASAGLHFFIQGYLLSFVMGISFFFEKLIGRFGGLIGFFLSLILLGFFRVGIPLFLLARLVLVFKKDGFSAFLGALVGELLVVIPYVYLLHLTVSLFLQEF